MFEPLSKERFHDLLQAWHVPPKLNEEFLYMLHEQALNGLSEFLKLNPTTQIRGVNPILLTLYCLHEHAYFAGLYQPDKLESLENDDGYFSRIVSAAIDKYLTNEHLEVREAQVKTRFYPPTSTLKMYVNTLNGLLSGFQGKLPSQTLLTDFIKKSVSLLLCSLDLLTSGFETEAFSTWRTLHETEAILMILHHKGAPAIKHYLRHLQYGFAFHHLTADKNKSDAAFAEIKETMRAHELKSKDTKKFIEYGWMYPLWDKDGPVRLNFRDGVQVLAGLERYNKAYEMSSEITHSSPLLIYSRRQTFYEITLVYLYETFFRIETIFKEAFLSGLPELAINQYETMRGIYFEQLRQFHQIESGKLRLKQKAK